MELSLPRKMPINRSFCNSLGNCISSNDMCVFSDVQNLVEVKSVLGQSELLSKAYGLIAVSV